MYVSEVIAGEENQGLTFLEPSASVSTGRASLVTSPKHTDR